MSDEGKKGTTLEKIPKWEAELWSYVSSGDGMHCPLYSRYQANKGGGWCPDENRERVNRLLDKGQFNLDSCDFIESEAKGLCRLCELVEMLAQKYLEMGEVRGLPVPTGFVTLFDQQHTVEVRQLPLKVLMAI
ncbi:unnamed protein product [marine sediment metagenome]|uniref:Uncharacterized protein n=1 Tax=marine sediment metagenome TaxID=412755 RepID=X1EMC4_9ZZZZ